MDDEEIDERLRNALNNAFQSLDPQTREIISCHFGLGSPFVEMEGVDSDDNTNSKNSDQPTPKIVSVNGHRNGTAHDSNHGTEPFSGAKPENSQNGQLMQGKIDPAERKSISELALEYGLSTEQVELRKDDGLRALIYGRKTRFQCS